MITNTLLVWAMGWAVCVACMGFTLRQSAKTGEGRAASAQVRVMWGTKEGRAFLCLLMLAAWPVFVPVILYAAWDWLTDH